MDAKPKYRTKQREILLEYLKRMTGVHITVKDACEYLEEQGTPVGQTTVYRQLERMVDEGLVNKYIIDGIAPACFEYIADEEQGEKEVCFHCKCEKCGKLIHLHCDEMQGIKEHLFKEHAFQMDPLRTVFYGVCAECR
ncbi:MAG: transcriptional repressor [Lachnospiraceae bacterium]|nr:transcriptional repressor [Lachnospiraceae bacterium]